MMIDGLVGSLQEMKEKADCRRRRVTALVCLEDGTVVGWGWNGLQGGPSCLQGHCPRGLLTYEQQPQDIGYAETGCSALHAEDMALQQAGLLAGGAVVLVTEKPCPGCAALLREANVSAVLVVEIGEDGTADIRPFEG